jgi:hypothetical protein
MPPRTSEGAATDVARVGDDCRRNLRAGAMPLGERFVTDVGDGRALVAQALDLVRRRRP